VGKGVAHCPRCEALEKEGEDCKAQGEADTRCVCVGGVAEGGGAHHLRAESAERPAKVTRPEPGEQ